jgi:Flp pilus assembly protein TadD
LRLLLRSCLVSALQSKARQAIASSLKALQLSPDNAVVIKTNLAYGHLLDNRFDKAKAVYLENKDAKLGETSEY